MTFHMIHFDPSISFGVAIQTLIFVLMLLYLFKSVTNRLISIEQKQDHLIKSIIKECQFKHDK